MAARPSSPTAPVITASRGSQAPLNVRPLASTASTSRVRAVATVSCPEPIGDALADDRIVDDDQDPTARSVHPRRPRAKVRRIGARRVQALCRSPRPPREWTDACAVTDPLALRSLQKHAATPELEEHHHGPGHRHRRSTIAAAPADVLAALADYDVVRPAILSIRGSGGPECSTPLAGARRRPSP